MSVLEDVLLISSLETLLTSLYLLVTTSNWSTLANCSESWQVIDYN